MAPLGQTQVLSANYGAQNYHEQISHLEQNKQMELMAGQLLYLNENPEPRNSLESLDNSFNLGHPGHSVPGYNYEHFNGGYQQGHGDYSRRDSGCFIPGHSSNVRLFEQDEPSWSPQSKYNHRHSHGFQDFMNHSNAEDIPFTEDDFPSLSKESHSTSPKQADNHQAEALAKEEALRNRVWESLVEANKVHNVQNHAEQSEPSMHPAPSVYRQPHQFVEHQPESSVYQLPMFSPPHQGFFTQSVLAWNSRKMFQYQNYPNNVPA